MLNGYQGFQKTGKVLKFGILEIVFVQLFIVLNMFAINKLLYIGVLNEFGFLV